MISSGVFRANQDILAVSRSVAMVSSKYGHVHERRFYNPTWPPFCPALALVLTPDAIPSPCYLP